MNEFQLASARAMLRALKAKGDLTYRLPDMRRSLPAEIVDAIKEREAEYRDANKAVKENGAMLSEDAAEYWKDCQAMLAYGRMIRASGQDRANGKPETALSRKCERLEETFEAKVPDAEKGKFVVYQVDGSIWDDRWDACVDWFPPILRADLADPQPVFDNPRRAAQIDMLEQLVTPYGPAPAAAASKMQREKLRQLARSLDDGIAKSDGGVTEG